MNKALIDNEFEESVIINLRDNFLRNDLFSIISYYDELINTVNIRETSDLISFNYQQFNNFMRDTGTIDEWGVKFKAIDYGINNNIDYLSDYTGKYREKLIGNYIDKGENVIFYLKKSCLKFDILSFTLSLVTPKIFGYCNNDFIKEFLDFKTSFLGESFKFGIDKLTERYEGNYYLSPSVEQDLRRIIIKSQQKIFDLAKVSDVKEFKTNVSLTEAIGFATGFVLPFIPLSSLKELYAFLQRIEHFKNNPFLDFTLSLIILGKIVNKYYPKGDLSIDCVICKKTFMELNQIDDAEVLDFLEKNSDNICLEHNFQLLHFRKTEKILGKRLLLSLKLIK